MIHQIYATSNGRLRLMIAAKMIAPTNVKPGLEVVGTLPGEKN
jgi:hypothetical protein